MLYLLMSSSRSTGRSGRMICCEWVADSRTRRPVGYTPPADAEKRYDAVLGSLGVAARLKRNGLRQPGAIHET